MGPHLKMRWIKSSSKKPWVTMSKNMNFERKLDGKNKKFMKNESNVVTHINKMHLKGAKNATIKYILMESIIPFVGRVCPGEIFYIIAINTIVSYNKGDCIKTDKIQLA